MQCLDHVMLKSESVVTCSVFFRVYYKSATFLLVPSSFLPLLDIFPLYLLCVGDAIWKAS